MKFIKGRYIFLISLLLYFSSFTFVHGKEIYLPNVDQRVEFTDIGHYYLWATEFKKHDKNFIMSAVGRPTAPLYKALKEGMNLYASQIGIKESIDYGDLQGEEKYRLKMANALTRQYKTPFSKENILFTVGGRFGLSAITHIMGELKKDKKTVITFPFYPDYKRVQGSNNEFIMVDTLNYEMSAANLKKSLEGIDKSEVGAFIFCSPNNPMGWMISREEWGEIAKILEFYEDAIIILDEAYAEITFASKNVSLISVAPHLKDRIILLRSATKGFSASGERMAILVTWNPSYMEYLKEYQFTRLIHAPKSGQFAYTYAMERLKPSDLDSLSLHYKPQVRMIEKALKETEFSRGNSEVEGSFYVIANFKELIGKSINSETKIIYPEPKEKIEDDVDIGFHLMSQYGLAFMPLSLFGVDPKEGLLRITCSGTPHELKEIVKRLHRIRRDIDSDN